LLSYLSATPPINKAQAQASQPAAAGVDGVRGIQRGGVSLSLVSLACFIYKIKTKSSLAPPGGGGSNIIYKNEGGAWERDGVRRGRARQQGGRTDRVWIMLVLWNSTADSARPAGRQLDGSFQRQRAGWIKLNNAHTTTQVGLRRPGPVVRDTALGPPLVAL